MRAEMTGSLVSISAAVGTGRVESVTRRLAFVCGNATVNRGGDRFRRGADHLGAGGNSRSQTFGDFRFRKRARRAFERGRKRGKRILRIDEKIAMNDNISQAFLLDVEVDDHQLAANGFELSLHRSVLYQ